MSQRPHALPGVVLVVLAALVAAVFTGSLQPGAAAVTQSGSTSLSAPNVQPGGRPAAADKAVLLGTVRFSPAKKGRPVQIQRSVDGGLTWQDVGKPKKQNSSGVVTFTGPAEKDLAAPLLDAPYSYRGVARPYKGLAAVSATEQSAAVWQQKFTDEFSGTSLSDQWADRTPDSKECAKVGDPRASKVGRGVLKLSVMRDPRKRHKVCRTSSGKFHWYLNGQVTTQGLDQRFSHGTYSARIRFHKHRGAHGAFWMQPYEANHGARPAVAGAEIDIAEFFGKGYPGGGLASFLYNYGVLDKHGDPVKIGGVDPSATKALPKGDAWWKRYHVFSMEWTSNSYRFSVDGRTHSVITKGVTSNEEFMILGLMTSAWELKQAKRLGVSPTGSMQVDWVRVWQHS